MAKEILLHFFDPFKALAFHLVKGRAAAQFRQRLAAQKGLECIRILKARDTPTGHPVPGTGGGKSPPWEGHFVPPHPAYRDTSKLRWRAMVLR